MHGRRRALMEAQGGEKPWEDISSTLPLSGFRNGTGIAHSTSGGNIRVYTSSNGTYRSAYQRWTSTSGYEYKLEADVSYVKGTILLQTSKEGNATVNQSTQMKSSGHLTLEFPYNAEIAFIRLFVTWGTSEAGDATFSNVKLYRRATT